MFEKESTCGNGKLESSERCDDGNTNNHDGCSSLCQIEYGYYCSNTGDNPSTCHSECGDGRVAFDEECDDKTPHSFNSDGKGDGCTECKIEKGFKCINIENPARSHCSRCGDGLLLGEFEQCDDYNNKSNDGCNSECQVEEGWVCATVAQPCVRKSDEDKSFNLTTIIFALLILAAIAISVAIFAGAYAYYKRTRKRARSIEWNELVAFTDEKDPVAPRFVKAHFKGTYRGQPAFLKPISTDSDIVRLVGLEHPNILKVFCARYNAEEAQFYKVCEWIEDACTLSTYLQHAQNDLNEVQLFSLALKVCNAMCYIGDVKLQIHGGLCAKHILVSNTSDFENLNPKVTKLFWQVDGKKAGEYWYAPEVFQSSPPYCSSIDVWAYGITVWEIFSQGAEPFQDLQLSFKEAIRNIHSVLQKPPLMCQPLWNLIVTECWQSAPSRPSFIRLHNQMIEIFNNEYKGFHMSDAPIPISLESGSSESTSAHIMKNSFTYWEANAWEKGYERYSERSIHSEGSGSLHPTEPPHFDSLSKQIKNISSSLNYSQSCSHDSEISPRREISPKSYNPKEEFNSLHPSAQSYHSYGTTSSNRSDNSLPCAD